MAETFSFWENPERSCKYNFLIFSRPTKYLTDQFSKNIYLTWQEFGAHTTAIHI